MAPESRSVGPQTVAVYPGTFDPVTRGHLDIVTRAARLCDRLVVGVARNDGKSPLFSTRERVDLVEAEVAPLVERGFDVEVRAFENLLVHFAASEGATMIVRGLRAVSDFEYEFQMAGMNAKIGPDVETCFLMASDRYQFVSSRFVREIARLDGDVSQFVSAHVYDRMMRKFAEIA